MDILKTASQTFGQHLAGANSSPEAVQNAISHFLDAEDGNIEAADLVKKINVTNVKDLTQSSLVDADNPAISAEKITDIFGSEKIKNLCDELGCDKETVMNALSAMLPEVMGKISAEGGLKELTENSGGLLNMIKSFLRK